MGQGEQWRILAEEAAQEKDPEKLSEIIQAITRALDERELQRSHASQQGAAVHASRTHGTYPES
jgi:hypothetical protein